jgi:16S rRNA (guanine1207-N2)-methyltransferase
MEHYYYEKPVAKEGKKLIFYNQQNHEFKFYTSSSVFSKDKVDKGTELLVKECIIGKNAKILDIGCGYGVIGIVIGKLNPDAKITMSDINERALELAKENLKLNNVEAGVVKSFLFENINEKFDIILSNPPNSAGKELCFELISQAYEHLENRGSLQTVVHKMRGAKSYEKKVEEVFGNVKTIGRKAGYHLFYSEKRLDN